MPATNRIALSKYLRTLYGISWYVVQQLKYLPWQCSLITFQDTKTKKKKTPATEPLHPNLNSSQQPYHDVNGSSTILQS